jgi:hypothetical protein
VEKSVIFLQSGYKGKNGLYIKQLISFFELTSSTGHGVSAAMPS